MNNDEEVEVGTGENLLVVCCAVIKKETDRRPTEAFEDMYTICLARICSCHIRFIHSF